MKIDQDKINQVLLRYNKSKGEDVHINDFESEMIKRHKDMTFGKLLGYEEVLKQLGILDNEWDKKEKLIAVFEPSIEGGSDGFTEIKPLSWKVNDNS